MFPPLPQRSLLLQHLEINPKLISLLSPQQTPVVHTSLRDWLPVPLPQPTWLSLWLLFWPLFQTDSLPYQKSLCAVCEACICLDSCMCYTLCPDYLSPHRHWACSHMSARFLLKWHPLRETFLDLHIQDGTSLILSTFPRFSCVSVLLQHCILYIYWFFVCLLSVSFSRM